MDTNEKHFFHLAINNKGSKHNSHMRLVGSWSDAVKKSNEIVNDDKLNPNVADFEVICLEGNEATNIEPRVYINEQERVTTIKDHKKKNEPFTMFQRP